MQQTFIGSSSQTPLATGTTTVRITYPGGAVLKNATVAAAISQLDVDHGTNTRIQVYADGIDDAGFNMNFVTWADTYIYSVTATWIAVGTV